MAKPKGLAEVVAHATSGQAAGTLSAWDTISSLFLYAPGCFYFYPWKPAFQALCGDSYQKGYEYFRRDHSDATNLALHLVALVWQLLGNFGLLCQIDEYMQGSVFWGRMWLGPVANAGLGLRPVSALTAFVWSGTLLASPAPFVASLASTLAIVGAYVVAPAVDPRLLEAGAAALFFLVLLACGVLRPKAAGRSLLKDVGVFVKFFVIAASFRVAAARWRGAYAGSEVELCLGVLCLELLLATLPKPTVPTVFGGVIAARVAAELVALPSGGGRASVLLLFYAQGFVAQLSQGCSHEATGQNATLISHEEGGDTAHTRKAKLGFEWAHCSFFPSLLLHSCHESLTAPRPKDK
jgi:hypothetical protein